MVGLLSNRHHDIISFQYMICQVFLLLLPFSYILEIMHNYSKQLKLMDIVVTQHNWEVSLKFILWVERLILLFPELIQFLSFITIMGAESFYLYLKDIFHFQLNPYFHLLCCSSYNRSLLLIESHSGRYKFQI